MPKRAKELPPVEVNRLKEPGRHRVGGVAGLILQVSDTRARSWLLRTSVGGRRRDIGLGAFPDIPLKAAKERAREALDKIKSGIDPVAERRAARDKLALERARALTFGECLTIYMDRKQEELRNAKHTAQWTTSIKTYAKPLLHLPVAEIETAHIIKSLEKVWYEKPETASRVRGRIENILGWATVREYRKGDNPARWRGHLDQHFPKKSKLRAVQHFTALPFDEAPAFMADLRQREGLAARALEFAILTAARSGEVRGARWDEIDLKKKLWTIPGERMKAKKEHIVPLSPDAVKLLEDLPRLAVDMEHVFPAPQGGTYSDMSMGAVLRRMDVNATVHGFRSSFRDWCSERTNYPHEVAEMALAHTIPSAVERAYRRGDLLMKRTRLMSEWAKFLNKPVQRKVTAKGENVVALRS